MVLRRGGGSLEWRLGTGLGEGPAAGPAQETATFRPGLGLWPAGRRRMRGCGRVCGAAMDLPSRLRRSSSPCPPSGGCWRPGPSGRRAVTLPLPVPPEGRGLREGSAPLPGPNAGSLGAMGERSAYQRLAGGEEGQQVMGEAWGIARYLGPRPHHLPRS